MILQLFESGGVFIGMTRHEQQQPRILVSKSLILFRKGTPSSAKTKFVFWSTPFSIVGGGGTAAVQRIEVSIQFEVRVIIMSFQQGPALKRGPSSKFMTRRGHRRRRHVLGSTGGFGFESGRHLFNALIEWNVAR